MYFCVNRAIIMTGSVIATLAAINPPQSMPAYPRKLKIATGSVLVLSFDNTSAKMKLFHEKMKDSIPAVAIPGVDSGILMCKKAPILVSPST